MSYKKAREQTEVHYGYIYLQAVLVECYLFLAGLLLVSFFKFLQFLVLTMYSCHSSLPSIQTSPYSGLKLSNVNTRESLWLRLLSSCFTHCLHFFLNPRGCWDSKNTSQQHLSSNYVLQSFRIEKQLKTTFKYEPKYSRFKNTLLQVCTEVFKITDCTNYPSCFLPHENLEASHLKVLEKSVRGSMLITICRWENRGFEF